MFYAILITFFIQGKSECIVPNCETCSPFSGEICINCNQGFTRDKYEGCIQAKNPDCPDNNCLDIRIPFIIENCAQYSSLSECLQCESGYELINGRCSPLCFDYCLCFDPYECFESRYRKLATCTASNCLTCCSGSTTSCCTCNTGHSLLYGTCYSCSKSNCQSCNTSYTICDVCKSGYNLTSAGTCELICSSNCTSCNSAGCLTCANGYGLKSKVCTKCSDTNCKDCSSNYLKCVDCNNLYYLYSNKVCQIMCEDINCETCSSYSNCSTCYTGYYVSSGKCYKYTNTKCDSNCLKCDISNACTQCKTGYYLSSANCYLCPSNCDYCYVYYACDTCSSGYSLDNSGYCDPDSTIKGITYAAIIIPILGYFLIVG